MYLQVIQSSQEFEQLYKEWNDLLACCSASHVPFLRNEYLSTWWKTLGGGEWKHGELFIITALNQQGELSGIAPLFFTENLDGEPALMFIGSIEISDYLDFIVREPDLPSFTDALLEFLLSPQTPAWRVLDLYNIPETSPSLAALKSSAQIRGYSYSQQRLQPCPYILLPSDWETYLAGIDKKQRHEIRRKIRRAEEANPPARWYIVEHENQLDDEMQDFFSLMAQDPEKNSFLTQTMREQMRATAHAAFQAGWLQLAFLEFDGKKAAGYLNFDYAGHIWVYNSGLNFELRELSPGWVLLSYLLRWAIANGRQAFDFMRGDEDYKYRFGAVNRYIVRARIIR